MLLFAAIFLICIVMIKIFHDYTFWKKEQPIDHPKEWRGMAFLSTVPMLIMTAETSLQWWFSIPLSFSIIALIIWLLFDGGYNLIRKFNWWFTGSNDPDDAKTDDFLQKLTLIEHIIVKTLPLIGLILLYILTF